MPPVTMVVTMGLPPPLPMSAMTVMFQTPDMATGTPLPIVQAMLFLAGQTPITPEGFSEMANLALLMPQRTGFMPVELAALDAMLNSLVL